MSNMKLNEMENINGGEGRQTTNAGPQYTGGGITEKGKEILRKTRKTFAGQL